MRNVLNLLMIVALAGGTAVAQQSSEGVDRILKELAAYSEPAPSAGTLELLADAPALEDVLAEPEPAAAEMPGLEALLEENQEPVLGGEYVQSQQGVEQVLDAAPQTGIVRRNVRALRERDYRSAAVKGMDAVDAAWSTAMVLRPYALATDAMDKMELEETTGPVDVRTLFPQVAFPKGAKAIFQPDTNILFVRNTQQNLAKLEAILDATGVLKDSGETDQVEIEAKFIEVSEGALAELGFQWNFNDPTPVGIGTSDLDVNDGPGGLFANALRGSPTGSSPNLPFIRPRDLGDGFTPANGDWSTFRFEDAFNDKPSSVDLSYAGGTPFDMVISALDQSSGADVLSAPRIVTKSGEEATIRVGERHFFPQVFEGDAEQASMLYVAYDDFEEIMLGVELSVTPEVDGDEIALGLHPRITELAGWQYYQMAAADTIYSHRQNLINYRYKHPAIVGKLPIFKTREIETTVRIADGSTIGMGGLISDKKETFEDRVPVLGSIPLVGRLFRNEGERVVKRNLLMFVTARKVDPNGRVYTARSFE